MSAPRKSKSKAVTVGDLVHKMMGEIQEAKLCTQDEIFLVWQDVVGAPAAGHAKPSSLRSGVLRVSTDNPGWLQQLNFQKRFILKKLQSHFGKDKITEIRFKIGAFSAEKD